MSGVGSDVTSLSQCLRQVLQLNCCKTVVIKMLVTSEYLFGVRVKTLYF